MRIISNYHDYYDTVSAYGTDNTIKYFRKKQDFHAETPEYNRMYKAFVLKECRSFRAYDDFITNYWIISFCGKMVPVIEYWLSGIYHICYDIEASDKIVQRYGNKIQNRLWKLKATRHRESLRSRALRIFNHTILSTEELHHSLKAPVIMYDKMHDKLVINPVLREIEFYKYMDSYTTYQELTQYVSGVLSNTNQPPDKISDEDKKVMHGFDRWSFKTMPKDK